MVSVLVWSGTGAPPIGAHSRTMTFADEDHVDVAADARAWTASAITAGIRDLGSLDQVDADGEEEDVDPDQLALFAVSVQ